MDLTELLLRFLIGGIVVSVFALLGDLFTPKTFAGLFAAAPSVALATLALTINKDGKSYAEIEARSMVAGAVALFVYSWAASWTMMHHRIRAAVAATALITVWLATAFGVWSFWLR
ncbi:MAG: hypothetical protein JWM69_1197 [Candidatus Binatus sp.]|nr:hypothetical protein [Candidatus Binatus sp.]